MSNRIVFILLHHLALVFQKLFFHGGVGQVLFIFAIIIAVHFLLGVGFFLIHQIGCQVTDQCHNFALYCKTLEPSHMALNDTSLMYIDS